MASYFEDTIAAIATPRGAGAIAILRLSGVDAYTIAGKLLRRADGAALSLDDSHRARRARLLDGTEDRPLDEVLVLPMLGPGTATGEDCVEIHCHGGAFLLDLALRATLAAGARAARPGEFTQRGFLNGRLDLCQAEAVADLAEAGSQAGLHAAWQQLEGGLSQRIHRLRDQLLDTRALVEAHLDFPEEDLPAETQRELETAQASVVQEMEALAATFARGRLAREGVRLVLAGRPNVGKSSLMNALLGRERALVSEVPGTTRDYLEEPLAIGDLQALLSDTAGIHVTRNVIEMAGVARSREQIEAADILLVVFDGSKPLSAMDREILEDTAGRPRLLLRNKSDLDEAWSASSLGATSRLLPVSAKTGSGLAPLCQAVLEMLPADGETVVEKVVVTRARHHEALTSAGAAAARAGELLSAGGGLDLVACELQAATAELDALVGLSTPEDVLDRIFERFCIGK
ncbi:MAG: tRNA uridine-5-carboxymethylaminomethyl(34) synthesis GTPase MnmE [bacterium]